MTKEMQIAALEGRISLLQGRGKSNSRVIGKLQRKIKKLKA